jgi:hypothetical protein
MPAFTGTLLPGLPQLSEIDLLAEEVGAAFFICDAEGGEYILEVGATCRCIENTFSRLVRGVRVANREEARVRSFATDPYKFPAVARFLRVNEQWDRGAVAPIPHIVSIARVR